MSQYLDKDGASRIAENFLLKQSEQDAILENLRFDLKEAEHALVKTIQGPAPLNIRALTRPLDDYAISGNMVQNGTPSSGAPVDVVGCGERTRNLWSEDYTGISASIKYIPVYVGNGTFTLSTSCPEIEGSAALFFFAGSVQSGASTVSNGVYKDRPITVTSTDGYVTVAYRYVSYATGSADPRNEKTMLNLGSTALPYEPYGYKLPLTIGGTEYPIHLGEVQSTRKIKKLVFTGNERWSLWPSDQPDVERYYYKWGKTTPLDYGLVCTHFLASKSDGNFEHVRLGGNIRDDMVIFISKTIAPTVADFKSYLATQYAAGTPVTVWYVLAEPETGIVNEPLHKIGDYADTISMTQAGVEISTVKGFNTITTDTTVLPSNIEVKGVINNA